MIFKTALLRAILLSILLALLQGCGRRDWTSGILDNDGNRVAYVKVGDEVLYGIGWDNQQAGQGGGEIAQIRIENISGTAMTNWENISIGSLPSIGTSSRHSVIPLDILAWSPGWYRVAANVEGTWLRPNPGGPNHYLTFHIDDPPAPSGDGDVTLPENLHNTDIYVNDHTRNFYLELDVHLPCVYSDCESDRDDHQFDHAVVVHFDQLGGNDEFYSNFRYFSTEDSWYDERIHIEIPFTLAIVNQPGTYLPTILYYQQNGSFLTSYHDYQYCEIHISPLPAANSGQCVIHAANWIEGGTEIFNEHVIYNERPSDPGYPGSGQKRIREVSEAYRQMNRDWLFERNDASIWYQTYHDTDGEGNVFIAEETTGNALSLIERIENVTFNGRSIGSVAVFVIDYAELAFIDENNQPVIFSRNNGPATLPIVSNGTFNRAIVLTQLEWQRTRLTSFQSGPYHHVSRVPGQNTLESRQRALFEGVLTHEFGHVVARMKGVSLGVGGEHITHADGPEGRFGADGITECIMTDGGHSQPWNSIAYIWQHHVDANTNPHFCYDHIERLKP